MLGKPMSGVYTFLDQYFFFVSLYYLLHVCQKTLIERNSGVAHEAGRHTWAILEAPPEHILLSHHLSALCSVTMCAPTAESSSMCTCS